MSEPESEQCAAQSAIPPFNDSKPARQIALIEQSFDAPAMNLALEEALLDACETGGGGEVLRIWESPVHFAVLGVAQVLHDEVNEPACERDGVAIMRRCSAGGAVVQGLGCINYSVVLRYENHPIAQNLRSSYCYILGTLVRAFAEAGVVVAVRGTSDLAMGDHKISGSAQKRRKHAMLHHGTFLYDFDLARIPTYLREPAVRPDYRGKRTHDSFVRNVPFTRNAVRGIILTAFQCKDHVSGVAGEEVLAQAREFAAMKYADPAWIRRR